jgi:mannan endo-1,4-beta-mannosidase
LDKVIEVARRKGVRVIIPFVDQAQWWGGIGEYAAFRGKSADDFWTDPQIIDDFKATVRYLLTRKNIGRATSPRTSNSSTRNIW